MVMRGGMHIGAYTSTLNVNQQPWVQKEANPLPKFNLSKEKETYQEVTIVEWVATLLQQPQKCVPTHEPEKHKNTLVEEDPIQLFFQNYLGLMKNEVTLQKLHKLLDQCAQESNLGHKKEPKKVYTCERQVNKVVHRKHTN